MKLRPERCYRESGWLKLLRLEVDDKQISCGIINKLRKNMIVYDRTSYDELRRHWNILYCLSYPSSSDFQVL